MKMENIGALLLKHGFYSDYIKYKFFQLKVRNNIKTYNEQKLFRI